MAERSRTYRSALIGATSAVILLAPSSAAGQEPQVEEVVTVTATRQPFAISDIAAPAAVIPGSTLRRHSLTGIDEALVWQSSFSLLRRTPARAAHPTTQGLNLRGVAPSGTSRALVLVDGIPLTDALGGWVTWSKVPPLLIESAESVPGGASSTFGNQALAGALQFRTRQPPLNFEAAGTAALGELGTQRAGFVTGGAGGDIKLLAAVDIFHTSGYVATAPEDAGSIDTNVGSRHATGALRATLGGATLGLDYTDEARRNGTPARVNSTEAWGVHGRWSFGAPTSGGQLTGAYRDQRFDSVFSSVAADRESETPVLDQRVDSTDVVLAGNWWRATSSGLNLGAGADWRRVEGTSEEQVLLAGFTRTPGGGQRVGGGYAAAQWIGGDVALEGALRVDGWTNEPNDDTDPRSLTEVSPRAGIVWHAAPDWTLRASAYRSFRAPTLNELYRQFRVGNVVTRANASLTQERLRGVEAGAEFDSQLGSASITVRGHAYLNQLEDAVINATIGSAGSLVLRQRANLGEATVRGVELGVGLGWSEFAIKGNATFIDSRIDADVPGGPVSTVGNRLPQVPNYRATIAGIWQGQSWSADLAVHATGEQFEDDRNEIALASGITLDAGVRWALRPGWEVALTAQNVLNRRVEVARTSVLALGPPRTLALQLAWETGAR